MEATVELRSALQEGDEALDEFRRRRRRLAPEARKRAGAGETGDVVEGAADAEHRLFLDDRGKAGGRVDRNDGVGALHDLVDRGLAQEEDAVGQFVALDRCRDPRGGALDAVIERMLLDHEDGVGGRVGGEGADQFIDKGGVAAVARMHDELRVAGLLQQCQEHLAALVGVLERAGEHRRLVMRQAPEILAHIAVALAIDGIAVIIGVEAEHGLEGDGREEVGDGVDDVRTQAGREILGLDRRRGGLARFEIDLRIARQARKAVDAVALQRDPVRAQIAVFEHETVKAQFLRDFERAAVARQGVVERDDGGDFLAPHDAPDEPLPVAVAAAVDHPATARGLQILPALADSAQSLAARRLNLLRKPRKEGTERGADEKKYGHAMSHPCYRAPCTPGASTHQHNPAYADNCGKKGEMRQVCGESHKEYPRRSSRIV